MANFAESLPQKTSLLVLGGGLSGLSAAYHATRPAFVLEAESELGGECRSEQKDGFTFDRTGHWLHLRNPEMRALCLKALGEDGFVTVSRKSRIWSHGCLTAYPFQSHLYGLPLEVVAECLMGAINARTATANPELDEPQNFAEWICAYFGEGIARHFMLPYNARLWGVKANEITSGWCQRFVPKPNLEQIVRGALGCNAGAEGYNAQFIYPKEGGIASLSNGMGRLVGEDRIALNCRAQKINWKKKIAFTAKGEIAFEHLISSAPLPQLIGLLGDAVPEAVRDAAGKLRANEVTWLNLALNAKPLLPDHWIYVPEDRYPMYRVGSFSNAVPALAPEGCGSLYVELTDRSVAPMDQLPQVTAGLVEMGFIKDAAQIRFALPGRAPCAYVIYDFEYQNARKTVLDWLAQEGIQSIGRYGDWNYSAMEDALLAGRAAANAL